jgi:serine/threonine protein kinase
VRATESLDLIAARYRIRDRVGTGGMAQVYLARDESLGRDVALKIFRRELAEDEDLQRQQGEIRLLARLSHPSLVTLFDAISDDRGRAVLVLEYVPGSDVRARLARGPMPPAEVAALGADVARALAYIHGQGVVHRDISPANILLPDDHASGPTAKLTDLGIARLIDDAKITATGSVIGTAGYMSPEQVEGRPATPAGDVYSLGLVLLECLTGRRGYPGSAVESAVARLTRDPVVPPALPPAWRELLLALTARDPDARPTAAEAVERLSALISLPAPALDVPTRADIPTAAMTVGGAPEPTKVLPARDAPAAPPKPRPARRRVVQVVAGVALAVAVALVVVLIMVSTRHDAPRPDPVTSYPAVSGPLGDHLRQLEKQTSVRYEP